MNRFDKFTFALLQRASTAHDHLHVRINDLAQEFGIDGRYIQEKLAQLHEHGFLELSAWNEQENRAKLFNEWPSAEMFFAYASDGNYKRIRLLLEGAELLETAKEVTPIPHAKIAAVSASTLAIIGGLDRLRDELAEMRKSHRADEGLLDAKVKTWTKRAYQQLKDWGFTVEAEQAFGRNSEIDHYEGVDRRAKMRDDRLKALRDDLESHPEHYEQQLAVPSSAFARAASKPNKVFLGHGHSKLWARVHIYLKDELHVNVEAWESDTRAGLHSVEVLKMMVNSCTFAVLVATGEDATADGGIRTRQNVVHEIGLFQGRLGFEKVALLQQRGVEEFSNLAGLQVLPFDGEHIEGTFYDLQRMLKREKVI